MNWVLNILMLIFLTLKSLTFLLFSSIIHTLIFWDYDITLTSVKKVRKSLKN